MTYLRSGVGMKSRRTCVTESLLSALHGDNPCRIVLCGASGASHGCSVTGHGRKGRFRLRCCGNECDTKATAPVRADNPRRADRIVWLFDPKAPNEGRTAGLLTRSGRHAFPSPAGGSGGDCAAFVVEVTATGIVPELHRRSLFIPPPHDAAARNRHPCVCKYSAFASAPAVRRENLSTFYEQPPSTD